LPKLHALERLSYIVLIYDAVGFRSTTHLIIPTRIKIVPVGIGGNVYPADIRSVALVERSSSTFLSQTNV